MATKIYATTGDAARVVSTTLKDDGVARDLTTADTIECHVRNRSTGTVTVLTGLSGDASGVVLTTLSAAAMATAGTYTLEWEVTEGSQITTYPAEAAARPNLIVRTEAD